MEMSLLVKLFDDQTKSESIDYVKIIIFGTHETVKQELASGLERQWSERQRKAGSCGSKGLDFYGRVLDIQIDAADSLSYFFHQPLHLYHAAVMTYSADDDASHNYVCQVRDRIVQRHGRNIPIVFVAYMPDDSDLVSREVRAYRDLFISCEWGHGHYEMSAQTRDEDVRQIMEQVIRRIKDKKAMGNTTDNTTSTRGQSNIDKCREFCHKMFKGTSK